jgi:hypothetical protein
MIWMRNKGWVILATVATVVAVSSAMPGCSGGGGGDVGIEIEPILSLRTVFPAGNETVETVTGSDTDVVRAANGELHFEFPTCTTKDGIVQEMPSDITLTFSVRNDVRGDVVFADTERGVFRFKTVGPVGHAASGPEIWAEFHKAGATGFKVKNVLVTFR